MCDETHRPQIMQEFHPILLVIVIIAGFAVCGTTTLFVEAGNESRTEQETPISAATNTTSTSGQYSPTFLAEANNYNISNRVVDIFFFTRYCGPSSRLSERVSIPAAAAAAAGSGSGSGARARQLNRVTYAELDVCCRQHDNCPNYITESQHYAQYVGLEHRNQYFARMQCTCDGLFYQCLNDLQSRYASAVAIGYGIVQSYCFEFEHPIVRCARRSLWRCEEYVVDAGQPKRWQWFDVPPAYKKIFSIPKTQAQRRK